MLTNYAGGDDNLCDDGDANDEDDDGVAAAAADMYEYDNVVDKVICTMTTTMIKLWRR